MKGREIASNKSHINRNGGEEVAVNQLGGEVLLGDIIWVKLHRDSDSWWPAQVVDEKTVSGSVKPGNKSEGEILVRLYGTYTYLYVDPVKCRSEFDIILKQNNGCCREIFQKALEQDLRQLKSGKSKGKGLESKEMKIGASKVKKSNQNQAKQTMEIGASNNMGDAGDDYYGRGVRITRAMKADLIAKSSNGKPAERGEDQLGAKKINLLEDGFSVRRNPRRESTTLLKPATSSGEQTKSKNSKQNEVQKEVKPSCSSAEETKDKTPTKEKAHKKLKPDPTSAEHTKSKNSKQNEVQKELKPSSSSAVKTLDGTPTKEKVHKKLKPGPTSAEHTKSKNSKQNEVHKELKASHSSAEETKDKTPKQDKVLKKHDRSPSSSEPSARKMRVMQSLGLVAPLGSPFHKNGNI